MEKTKVDIAGIIQDRLNKAKVSLDDIEDLGVMGVPEEKFEDISRNLETTLLSSSIKTDSGKRNLSDFTKVSIITVTEKDEEIFNVLEFKVKSLKTKGNILFVNVEGKSAIKQKRVGLSKLKMDKMI